MEKKVEKSFDVELVFEDVQIGDTDRYDVTIDLNASDNNGPFCSCKLKYFDMPDVTVDTMEAMILKVTESLPFQAVISEKAFVKLEKKLLNVILDLNSVAEGTIGKTHEEKVKIAKDKIKTKDKKRSK